MLELPRPRSLVRTALWALSSLAACQTDDSTAADTGDAPATTDASATASPTSDATQAEDATTDTPSTVGDDSSSTSETEGDTNAESDAEGGDTLVEGCWDRESDVYYSDPFDFEPFGCPMLPIPCGPVEITLLEDALDTEAMTPEDIATADANARCVAAGLRDAMPGTYRVSASLEQGFSSYAVTYTVLADGAVATLDSSLDLGKARHEVYRRLHPAAYYEACIAAADVLGVMACLSGSTEGLSIGGVDLDACIDGEPACE